MTFSTDQIQSLQAPLSRDVVATRQQSGRALSYIEGWWAISEANRIFGFDAWSSATVEIRCVSERERKIGQQQRDGWSVSYVAKVRITVDEIVREGVGSGHGIDVDLGLAHESAIKEAETDARKRALMTFGNPFGLALYDKTQANVEATPAPQRAPPAASVPSRATKDQPWENRRLEPENEFPGVPEGTRGKTSHFARQAGDDTLFKEISAEIVHLESAAAVGAFIAGRKDAIAKMPAEWRATLRAALEEQKAIIQALSSEGGEAAEEALPAYA